MLRNMYLYSNNNDPVLLTRYQKRSLISDLRRLRNRILSGWTRNTFARDRSGRDVDALSNRACRWCLSGAISKEQFPIIRRERAILALKNAISFGGASDCGLAHFNDNCTKKTRVLDIIDEAIRIVKE